VNEGYTYAETIDSRGAGRLVADYLSARYRHSTMAQWLEHIEAGRVLLDDAAADPGDVLVLHQTLVWKRPPWEEPDAPLDVAVLWRDAGALVVHKPAGLPTLPGGGFLEHTLLHQVRATAPGCSPMHRLGRWTSGAVLFAGEPAARTALSQQFAARTVHKRYRALVSGSPAEQTLSIDTPIGPIPYAPLGTLHAATPSGRPSSSRVEVVQRRDGACLCDVTIATGRPHQIRIHLASVGHPLVGDPLYAAGGRPGPGCTALPGDPGYLLHAAEIGFAHPQSGDRVTVHAPPPAALALTSR